jgi:hypothetical protein
MTMGSRWITFALVGAIGYMLAVTFNWPAFAYYPLLNHFSLDLKLPAKTSGPSMLYYGWIVTAAAAALALAFVVPKSIAAKIPSALGWIVPLILIVYTFIYCGHWFTA